MQYYYVFVDYTSENRLFHIKPIEVERDDIFIKFVEINHTSHRPILGDGRQYDGVTAIACLPTKRFQSDLSWWQFHITIIAKSLKAKEIACVFYAEGSKEKYGITGNNFFNNDKHYQNESNNEQQENGNELVDFMFEYVKNIAKE